MVKKSCTPARDSNHLLINLPANVAILASYSYTGAQDLYATKIETSYDFLVQIAKIWPCIVVFEMILKQKQPNKTYAKSFYAKIYPKMQKYFSTPHLSNRLRLRTLNHAV